MDEPSKVAVRSEESVQVQSTTANKVVEGSLNLQRISISFGKVTAVVCWS
jgi:hypothetical protein